jgi:heptosyltransferase I
MASAPETRLAAPAAPVIAPIPENAHICVVLLTGLGDVIHGLPIVNAIRRAHPDCRITWVAEPMPASVLEPHPAIDRVVVFRKRDGLRGLRQLRRDLSSEKFDMALDFNIYFKSVFPTVFSGAPVRLGFDRARVRDGVWLFTNRRLPARHRAHTQDMFLEFLDAVGVPRPDPLEWRIVLTEEEKAAQQRFFAEYHGREIAAVVPASANAKKDWVPERYVELVDRLDREFGLLPMLLGGPGTRETEIARMVAEGALTDVVWAMGDGVRRLLWLIERSRIVIAPDTGPVHIARALQVPVVGLYGHTNPWRVGPYRAFEDLWVDHYNERGAAPDATLAEPKHGRMETITTDEVIARVRHALETYPPQTLQ